MKYAFVFVSMLALADCSGIRSNASGALPLGDASMRRAAAPAAGTLFVAVGDGTLPGSVVISAPPYATHGETPPTLSPLAVALTKNGALIVADDARSAPLSIYRPPYDERPSTIARFTWAGGMSLDAKDDIVLAQSNEPGGRATYLKEYVAPDYTTSIRFGPAHGRFITSVAALPNGDIAVGGVVDGPNDSLLPGSLEIYAPPYTQAPVKIAALEFVQAMTVVPQGLIAVVCSPCYGNNGSGSYLALVAPPYAAVTRVLTKLSGNAEASAVTSSANGDVFVNQGGVLYRYAPPYAHGQRISNTKNVLQAATAVAANGDLFFGETAQPGIDGSFTTYRLASPYTGTPQALFSTPGIPGGMTVSR